MLLLSLARSWLVSLAALSGLIILVFDLATRTGFKGCKLGPNDVFSDFEHRRLLLVGIVFPTDRKEVLPLLREQSDRAHHDCNTYAASGFLSVLQRIDAIVGNR